MPKTYPTWIDELAQAYHSVFLGIVPGKWSSLNGLAVYAAYQGAFLDRIYELMQAHQASGTAPAELAKLISNPSSFRWAFISLVREYHAIKEKELYREKARAIFDWLELILEASMQEDVWATARNIRHAPSEVEEILTQVSWIENDIQAVKNAGKLYVSTASLAFALYRDFFPQEAHEIFGPYDASKHFGDGAELIVKYFPKIKPIALWPQVAAFPYEEIKIYQILKGVHFKCDLIGMHSQYDGPVVPNTVAIAVEVDGEFIPKEDFGKIADEVAHYATDYSHLYEALNLSDAKKKFVEWESYQFVELFRVVGLDWRPTEAMLAPILAADIQMGLTIDYFPPYDEFISSEEYDIYWLKDLYTA